jgi:trk system potassium uptake protein TrkH
MISLSFFGVLFIATAITFFGESGIQHYPVFERLEIAAFQTVNAISTAGYNSIPLSNLTLGVLLTIIFLMYVGAAPSSTGGGMKITTLTAVIAIVKSKVRNQAKVTYLGKKIPADRLEMAVSTFIFYTAILFFSVFLLSFTENHSLEKLLFEATSAIGTVGLSMGITGSLSVWGKIILISIMFIGRVGVITFGLSILAKKQHKKIENETDLAV